MQSTGQTSTQEASFMSMQGSVMMYVTGRSLSEGFLAAAHARGLAVRGRQRRGSPSRPSDVRERLSGTFSHHSRSKKSSSPKATRTAPETARTTS